jgi:outer membrane protein TolC
MNLPIPRVLLVAGIALGHVLATTPAQAESKPPPLPTAAPPTAASVRLRVDEPALAALVLESAGNHELAARALRVRQATHERAAVRAHGLPSVDLDVRYTRTFGNSLDLGELVNPAYAALNQLLGAPQFPTDLELGLPLEFDARVRISQPLYAPAVRAGDRAARALVDVARHEASVARREVEAGVRVAWLQLARADQVIALLHRSRPLLEEALRVSELLAASELVTGDAVPRARAELAGFDQAVRDAVRGRASAARAVNALVAAPLDRAVAPPGPLAAPGALPALPRLLAHARRTRAEHAALAAGVRAAEADRAVAAAAGAPTLALALDLGAQGNGAPSIDDRYLALSVVGSWNLFAGGGHRATAAARRAGIETLAVRAAQLDQRIEEELRAAHAAAADATAAVASADTRIGAAQAAYDVVATRYQAGAVPQLELIAARTALLRAEIDRITALTDFHLALVELARAADLAPELP